MAKQAPSEKARYRSFYIVGLPILLLVAVTAVPVVIVITRQLWLAAPLIVIVVIIAYLVRCMIYWLSTPSERKVIAPTVNREPILNLLRDYLLRPKTAGSRPVRRPDPSGPVAVPPVKPTSRNKTDSKTRPKGKAFPKVDTHDR